MLLWIMWDIKGLKTTALYKGSDVIWNPEWQRKNMKSSATFWYVMPSWNSGSRLLPLLRWFSSTGLRSTREPEQTSEATILVWNNVKIKIKHWNAHINQCYISLVKMHRWTLTWTTLLCGALHGLMFHPATVRFFPHLPTVKFALVHTVPACNKSCFIHNSF